MGASFRILRLIFFLLMFSSCLIGQEQGPFSHTFTWIDRDDKAKNAVLKFEWISQESSELYRIKWSVIWFDQFNQPMVSASQKPFLYLHKFYFNISPSAQFRCITFNETSQTELLFQDSDNLLIQSSGKDGEEITIEAAFSYGFSREEILRGNMQRIRLHSGTKLRYSFPFIVADRGPERVAIQDPIISREATVQSMKSRFDRDLEQINIRLGSFAGFEADQLLSGLFKGSWRDGPPAGTPFDRIDSIRVRVLSEINRSRIVTGDLNLLISELEILRNGLTSDSLVAFSMKDNLDKTERFLRQAGELKLTVFNYRVDLEMAASKLSADMPVNFADSLLSVIRSSYSGQFIAHLDSLDLLRVIYRSLSDELTTYFEGPKSHARNNPHLDSLFALHETLMLKLVDLQGAHDTDWRRYRDQALGVGLVAEIESAHQKFADATTELGDSLAMTRQEIEKLRERVAKPGILTSRTLIWTGTIILLFLLLMTLVRMIIRYRMTGHIMKEGTSGRIESITGRSTVTGGNASDGLMDSAAYHEYFSVVFTESIPESVIGKVNIHTTAIKAVYQLVQGALFKKAPHDFGGYLLGSYYRMHSKEMSRFELFIDKVVPSASLRQENTNEVTERIDLVDEMDEVVRQNKKHLLLGWFAPTSDAALALENGLGKLHRTFFREKWQVGLLINPGTHDIQSAIFLRRKSGFFETYPDPASILNWDKLYEYAVNPPRVKVVETSTPIIDSKGYPVLQLRTGWCDSVVESLSFAHQVVSEIEHSSTQQANLNEAFSVLGFLYGTIHADDSKQTAGLDCHLVITRFIDSRNGSTPREIPDYQLLGWWGYGNAEIQDYLPEAIPYHEKYFRESHQLFALHNSASGEIRVFSRKNNLEMNNSIIETEEFNFRQLNKP